MSLLPILFALAAAAQSSDPAEPAQRQVAREMLEQLLAEEGNVSLSRDYRGHDRLSLRTRPRASNQSGLCQRDRLAIERAPAAAPRPDGSSTIRSLETNPSFFVLVDASGQPLWEVRGEDLERRCAAVQDAYAWFDAEDANLARAAVAGLFALREELGKPRSPLVERACRPGGCPPGPELATRIQPLRPSGVRRDLVEPCPPSHFCVSVLLENPVCGAWVTQLRMDGVHIERFRSAKIGWFVGALHCGEERIYGVPPG